MPAKKRAASAKKKAAPPRAKKKAAAKKRVAPPHAKKKAAAKRRAAARPGVPEELLRLAERTTKRQLAEREREHRRAVEEAQELRDGDDDTPTPFEPDAPADLLARLGEASRPGAVVASREQQLEAGSPIDSLTGDLVDGEGPRRTGHNTSATTPAATSARRSSGEVVIDVETLHVFYGAVEALRGISFRVEAGETVAIIGSNGAGKTTTLKTVSGVAELLKTVRGRVTILGNRVDSWPAHRIARLGVAHSPEGRKIFPNQTVRDNLLLGAFGRSDGDVDADIARMEDRFPILGQRRDQAAGLMSGGEQQMLAMARALMARPKVLLFDEPSMGLAPLIVKQIFDIIEELKREGKTILLVEQMAFQALGIADRAYVLETGEITMEGSGRDLLDDPRVKEAYLGA